MTIHDQVKEFMTKVPSQETPGRPIVPDAKTLLLRERLITEEFREYREAVERLIDLRDNQAPNEDLYQAWADIADALADLHYVVAGAGVAWGLPMNEVQDTVHQANMYKFGEGSWVREDGKQMKPPNWQPPDHVPTIKRACGKK
jgi:predicted HAD superfamily Cof-like phosphohydrolase